MPRLSAPKTTLPSGEIEGTPSSVNSPPSGAIAPTRAIKTTAPSRVLAYSALVDPRSIPALSGVGPPRLKTTARAGPALRSISVSANRHEPEALDIIDTRAVRLLRPEFVKRMVVLLIERKRSHIGAISLPWMVPGKSHSR